MAIEWDERRARRAQLIKFATAIAITLAIAAIPLVIAGIRIGL